jgi:hypothetical protein
LNLTCCPGFPISPDMKAACSTWHFCKMGPSTFFRVLCAKSRQPSANSWSVSLVFCLAVCNCTKWNWSLRTSLNL